MMELRGEIHATGHIAGRLNTGVEFIGGGGGGAYRHSFADGDWGQYGARWQLLIPIATHKRGAFAAACAVEREGDASEIVNLAAARTTDGAIRLRTDERFTGAVYII